MALTALTTLLLIDASGARAWVPAGERLAGLVAERNRMGQRHARLRLAVQVREADGEVIARGEAVIEPGGPARLELTYADGSREWYERRGAASRIRREAGPDGPAPGQYLTSEEVDVAGVSLLPPFALLQATSPQQLKASLRELGGDPTLVELGLEAGRDCWVLGGRKLGSFAPNDRAALWIDLETKEPVRIDTGSGPLYRLGPPVRFGDVQLPAWYEVDGSAGGAAADAPRRRVEIEALATAATP